MNITTGTILPQSSVTVLLTLVFVTPLEHEGSAKEEREEKLERTEKQEEKVVKKREETRVCMCVHARVHTRKERKVPMRVMN